MPGETYFPELIDDRAELKERLPFLTNLEINMEEAAKLLNPEELEFLKKGEIKLGKPSEIDKDDLYPKREHFESMNMEELIPLIKLNAFKGNKVRENPTIGTYERPLDELITEENKLRNRKIKDAIAINLVTTLYEQGINAYVEDEYGYPYGKWDPTGNMETPQLKDTKYDVRLKITEVPQNTRGTTPGKWQGKIELVK